MFFQVLLKLSFRRGAAFCAAPCWDSAQRKRGASFHAALRPLSCHPPPDGTGGTARTASFSRHGVGFTLGLVFLPRPPPKPHSEGQGGAGAGDGGRALLEPGWFLARRVAVERLRGTATEQRPGPARTRARPEPAPSFGSVVAVVPGRPAGSARVARHIARAAGGLC